MLQLLLEGGQGYDDIGSLLGIAPDEVRSRARSALTEIGGADPDAQVGLSDYLLGQADPIGRADAVRHLQSDPEANALAQRLVQNLRLLAPRADAAGDPGAPRRPPGSPAASPARGPRCCGAPPRLMRRRRLHPPRRRSARASPRAPPPSSAVAAAAVGRLRSPKRRTQAHRRRGRGPRVVIMVIVSWQPAEAETVAAVTASRSTRPPRSRQAFRRRSSLRSANPRMLGCPPTGRSRWCPCRRRTPAELEASQAISDFALQTNAANLEPTTNGERVRALALRSDHAGPAARPGDGRRQRQPDGCRPVGHPGGGLPAGLRHDPVLAGDVGRERPDLAVDEGCRAGRRPG